MFESLGMSPLSWVFLFLPWVVWLIGSKGQLSTYTSSNPWAVIFSGLIENVMLTAAMLTCSWNLLLFGVGVACGISMGVGAEFGSASQRSAIQNSPVTVFIVSMFIGATYMALFQYTLSPIPA